MWLSAQGPPRLRRASPRFAQNGESAPVFLSDKELLAKYNTSTDAKTRLKLVGDIQRLLATDAVNAYLFQLPQFAVARKPLKGLWSSSPIFANDLAALSW